MDVDAEEVVLRFVKGGEILVIGSLRKVSLKAVGLAIVLAR